MGKIKSIILKDSERLALETGFRQGDSHCFRMRCRAYKSFHFWFYYHLLLLPVLPHIKIGLFTAKSHKTVS